MGSPRDSTSMRSQCQKQGRAIPQAYICAVLTMFLPLGAARPDLWVT